MEISWPDSKTWGRIPELIAGVTAAVSVLVLVWRRGVILARTISAVYSLNHHFGPTAGKVLHEAIRELRGTQSALEIKQSLITKKLGIGLFVCDKEGEFIWANEVMSEQFGLDREHMLDHGWLKSVDDKQRVEVFEHWNACIENKIPYDREFDIINQRTDKKIRVHSQTCIVAVDDDIIFYVGYIEEVKNGLAE